MTTVVQARPLAIVLLSLLISLASGCGDDGDARPVVMETWHVASVQHYAGAPGRAYAHVCPGDNRLFERRFLIVAPGFAPNRIDAEPQPGELENTCANSGEFFVTLARDRGFHIIHTRWRNGADYIQRNAYAVRALIERLKSTYDVSERDVVVLIGTSMGGLVTRYALLSIEHENAQHDVDLWITRDSPLEGAYVPIGIQYLADTFRDDGSGAQVQTLDTVAARQMLLYHYSQYSNGTPLAPPTETPEFSQLYDMEMFTQLGDYPRAPNLRRVAIASGRGDGVLEKPDPGEVLIQGVKRNVFTRSVPTGFCTINFSIDIWAQAWALRLFKDNPSPLPSANLVSSSAVATRLDDYPFNIDSHRSVKNAVKNTFEARNCLPSDIPQEARDDIYSAIATLIQESPLKVLIKPYEDKYERFMSVVPRKTIGEGFNCGLGNDIHASWKAFAENGFQMLSGQPKFTYGCFIPTWSALGIRRTIASRVEPGDLENYSPFDRIFYQERNLIHGGTNDATEQGIAAEFDRLIQ